VTASFIVTPFSEAWRGPAHTFVTFDTTTPAGR
jgi:hypothetical protein